MNKTPAPAKSFRRPRRFAAALVSAVIVAGAGVAFAKSAAVRGAAPVASPPAATARRLLVDEIGRKVSLPAQPQRIVSLAPAITESLFAIGAGPQVVGVTRFCDFPEEAKTRTVVGGFADPDVERVVSLSPDLVVATADTVTRDRFDALVALGLPIYTVNPRDLAGVAAMLRHVGEATGHAEAGEARAKAFEASVKAIDDRVAGLKRVRALFLFSIDPPIAAGPSTFVDELLRRAGAENVAAHAPTSYPRYGAEGILAAAPDRIFTTVPGGAVALKKILGTSAARADSVLEVDADRLERPGPRLAEGLDLIARRLHPDAFPAAP